MQPSEQDEECAEKRLKEMSIRTIYGKGQDACLESIRKFPLRPFRSEADLDQAIAVIDN